MALVHAVVAVVMVFAGIAAAVVTATAAMVYFRRTIYRHHWLGHHLIHELIKN